MLAFVVVNPFHLNVEQRLRVDGDAGSQLDDPGEALLVVCLNLTPCLLGIRVLGVGLEFPKLGQVTEPATSDPFVNQTSEFGVAQREKTTWRNAIGDVEESGWLRLATIKILKVERLVRIFSTRTPEPLD
jgi:hypothetical protein